MGRGDFLFYKSEDRKFEVRNSIFTVYCLIKYITCYDRDGRMSRHVCHFPPPPPPPPPPPQFPVFLCMFITKRATKDIYLRTNAKRPY